MKMAKGIIAKKIVAVLNSISNWSEPSIGWFPFFVEVTRFRLDDLRYGERRRFAILASKVGL